MSNTSSSIRFQPDASDPHSPAGGADQAQCVILLSNGRYPCRNPAVVTAVIGCLSEHVRQRRYCRTCVDNITRGRVLCAPCHVRERVRYIQLLETIWDDQHE